mgnify:CR=1 FL=1
MLKLRVKILNEIVNPLHGMSTEQYLPGMTHSNLPLSLELLSFKGIYDYGILDDDFVKFGLVVILLAALSSK